MEPEETVDYNIRKTWYNITKMYNKKASDYMVSMSLGKIILNIDMFEGTPSTQLGPNMGMESTSLARSLNKLEDIGIIIRKTHFGQLFVDTKTEKVLDGYVNYISIDKNKLGSSIL